MSSNLPTLLRLGAVLLFSWAVRNPDETQETNATPGNIVLSYTAKDPDSNEVTDPEVLAQLVTIEEVDGGVDKATLTSDPAFAGYAVTFEGNGPVTWTLNGESVTKDLKATGTGTLSEDPSAGDTLAMTVEVINPA